MPDRSEEGARLAFEMTLDSTPAEVRRAVDRAQRALGRFGWCEEPRRAAELVLAEALNNIVEHAYGESPEGRIHVALTATAVQADLVVCDCGGAMPDGRLPPGEPVDLEMGLHDLPEGGFGWYLIRRLADRLVYRRCGGHNRLEIRIRNAVARGSADDPA
ncbi:ATP-binding protein [Salipiger sp. P9]|uniref:ATP-binding protein n=1 Tax=Salipiger pentaromativorans TaxID=2943193 RepID=UPI002157F64B|nr:ATP-binding protein [Salipiger pentaromativorans]MCR8547665.1 ATP-binding protein [Salipiger pentaromativorans]